MHSCHHLAISDSGSGSHCPKHRGPGFLLDGPSSLAKGTEMANEATTTARQATHCHSYGESGSLGGQAPRRHCSSPATPSMHPRELCPPANIGNAGWRRRGMK